MPNLSRNIDSATGSSITVPESLYDDLSRDVYCILGVPVDRSNMREVMTKIQDAITRTKPFLFSTPNLHFLVRSQNDGTFREALLASDLSLADGMPVIWISRLLGLPIHQRVAGSDLVEWLKATPRAKPIKVLLFGATEPVAAAAAKKLNAGRNLACAGWICPGFGSVEELSSDKIIDQINAHDADFLMASLGAEKGQLWLLRNHERLKPVVRAHLGATIHFQAGSVRRAPKFLHKAGLEWLWRITQEPHLFRRYWDDGWALLWLLATKVLPLSAHARKERQKLAGHEHNLVTSSIEEEDRIALRFSGFAVEEHVGEAIAAFIVALRLDKPVAVDLRDVQTIDARMLGLFMMARKTFKLRNVSLKFHGVSRKMRRLFTLHSAGFLLAD